MFSRISLAIFLTALGLAAPLSCGAALAQPRYDRGPEMRDGVQPLDRLLPGIRREHPGNFYDAEGPTYGPSGNPHYHLKWMTPEGRVIWYDTDARNGRVLRQSRGRDSFDDPEAAPSVAQPYMANPYERGYGGRYAPGFAPVPRYAAPGGGWPGRGGGFGMGRGNGEGRGGGRWRGH